MNKYFNSKFSLKNSVFAALVSLILTSVFPIFSYAHVLKTDGSIGAVLHIDPDDDPIAGRISTFYFEIKDKQDKFTPQACGCRVDISQEGKLIYSDNLFQQGSTNQISSPVFQYTFPQKGVYQVKVTGKPIQADAFQPFSLAYDIRVDREAPSASQDTNQNTQPDNWADTHRIHLIAIGIVVAIFVIALLKQI